MTVQAVYFLMGGTGQQADLHGVHGVDFCYNSVCIGILTVRLVLSHNLTYGAGNQRDSQKK